MNKSIIFDEFFEYRIIDKKAGGMGEVLILERISEAQEMDFIHKKSRNNGVRSSFLTEFNGE